jgi:hypothetical protein
VPNKKSCNVNFKNCFKKRLKIKKKSTTNQYRDDGRGGAPD